MKRTIIIISNWRDQVEFETVDYSEAKDTLVNKYLYYYIKRKNIIIETESYISDNYGIITTKDSEVIEFMIIEREL